MRRVLRRSLRSIWLCRVVRPVVGRNELQSAPAAQLAAACQELERERTPILPQGKYPSSLGLPLSGRKQTFGVTSRTGTGRQVQEQKQPARIKDDTCDKCRRVRRWNLGATRDARHNGNRKQKVIGRSF